MVNLKSFRPWIFLLYLFLMFTNSMFSFIDIPIKNIWKYDKLIHFVEYFILGLLLFYVLYEEPASKSFFLKSLLFMSLIPILDECIQYFTPRRISSLYDAMADYLGCYSGCFTYYIFNRFNNG